MFFVCVRSVFSETNSSRAMSGPSRSPCEQAQDLELALAQRLDQRLARRADAADRWRTPTSSRATRRRVPAAPRASRSSAHRRPFVEEHADVALRLGERERARRAPRARRRSPQRVAGERLDDQDLDDAPWRRRPRPRRAGDRERRRLACGRAVPLAVREQQPARARGARTRAGSRGRRRRTSPRSPAHAPPSASRPARSSSAPGRRSIGRTSGRSPPT